MLATARFRAFDVFVTVTAAALLAVPIRSAAARTPDSMPPDTLRELMSKLRGGPIELKPYTGTEAMVSMGTATENARQATGIPVQSERAWKTVITDREFMGGWLKAKPCWLLQCEASPFRDQGSAPKQVLFVVMDGKTGLFWEAFTASEYPWWKRVKVKNKAVIKRFEAWGQVSNIAQSPPAIDAARAVEVVVRDGFSGPYFEKAQQVIVRHFRYTTRDEGTQTDDGKIIPRIRDHPVWYITLEGINSPFTGPVPAPLPGDKPVRQPNIEEVNVVVSAVTGELLESGTYR